MSRTAAKIASERRYRERNREKIAERQRQYYQDNKEKISERSKKHYQDNKERILNNVKEYQKAKKAKEMEAGMTKKQGYEKNMSILKEYYNYIKTQIIGIW